MLRTKHLSPTFQRKNSWDKWMLILCGLLLGGPAFACIITTGAPLEGEPIGTITREISEVRQNDIDVNGTASLYNHDSLRVLSGGVGLLDFGSDVSLRLFNTTEAGEITGTRTGTDPDSPLIIQLALFAGGFSGQFYKPGSQATFTTPNGSQILIVGTEFFIVYDSVSGVTIAGNFSGTMGALAQGVSTVIASGFYLEIPEVGPPGEQFPISFTITEFEDRARTLRSPNLALEQLLDSRPDREITPTPSATIVPSITPTFTRTPSATITPSITTTYTPTPSATITPSITPTYTLTPSHTVSPSPSATYTYTPSPGPVPNLLFVTDLSKSTDRLMLYQGQEEDFFQVPVWVYVQNQSDIALDGLVISMRYGALDGIHSTMFRIEDQILYQSGLSIPPLSPGASTSYEAKVMVPRSYEGITIDIVATTDRCQIDVNCLNSNVSIKLPAVIYDFIENAQEANWLGYDPNIDKEYDLIFNGPVEDREKGSAGMASELALEDDTQPFYLLATHPTWAPDGVVEAQYFLSNIGFIQGDRLVARLGFIAGEDGDGVTFHLDCLNLDDMYSPKQIIFALDDNNDGSIRDVDITLSDQMLECSFFDLWVDAGPTYDQDLVAWIALYIERP